MVILLNADFTFLNTITWKRALKLLGREKVDIIKKSEKILHNYEGDFEFVVPLVVRLKNFIKQVYQLTVPFSKHNILLRDNKKCCYCGNSHRRMTIDHIIPKSKGGGNTWENCVTACKGCNYKKANKLLKYSGLKLQTKPKKLSIYEFLQCKKRSLGLELMV